MVKDPVAAAHARKNCIEEKVFALSANVTRPVLTLDWSNLTAQHPELAEFSVARTHGYYETFYPILNDAGLTMGESTCSAMIVKNEQAPAVFQVSTLMQLAMERCATARCAIRLMGRMAELYGFQPEESAMGGSGEALTIGDGDEVLTFRIAS